MQPNLQCFHFFDEFNLKKPQNRFRKVKNLLKMTAQLIPGAPGLIIINDTNLNTGIVNKEHNLIYSAYYWHKIYVQNALNFSRDFVLRTLMNAVHPLDFIPVCYNVEAEYITFLLKNCGAAISELCRRNLTIPHPDTHRKLPSFKIAIVLKHSHASELKIEIQNNIVQLLKKRYSFASKTLNLSSFVSDPDLNEFCPLSQPKLMYFVLHLSKDFEITHLKLNQNEIELLKPLEALGGEKNLKGLTTLDLRRNHISSLESLDTMKVFPITEIYLEDNPICEKLTEQEYIKLIRRYFPKITKIDGSVVPIDGILSIKRNFLCSKAGYNFVDQFLEFFFTLYDSPNRSLLETCYHRNAMFSLTSLYVGGSKTVPNSKLYEYKKYSRNLKTMSDLSKSEETLFFGRASIGKLFQMLPNCEHDPYTFSVDLILYTESMAIIAISGVFKEPGKSLIESDLFYSFARTFVLKSNAGIEFKILNDMWHVTNVTNTQLDNAFKVSKVPKPIYNTIPLPETQTEENNIINAMVALSNLKLDWAKKCLQECDFNLKRAIVLFIELLQEDKFPAEAFDFKDDIDISLAYNALKEIPMEPINIVPTAPRISPAVKKSIQPIHDDKIETKDIRNPIIMTALKLPLETPLEEAKQKLMVAGNLILTKHTFALKLYKAIGKEFYKFKLLSEARKFLTDAMTNMPKAMGEELYSIFTLYEIEYGDITVAENMILITAETYPVHKTVRFIGEHVGNINPMFALKMFEVILISNLPPEKKDVIKSTYESFKTRRGISGNKPAQSETKFNINDVSSITANVDPLSPVLQIITTKQDDLRKGPAFQISHDLINMSFEDFRQRLLMRADLIPYDLMSNEVKEFLTLTAKDSKLLELAERLVTKFKTNMFVVKTVCRKLWEQGFKDKSKEVLAQGRIEVTNKMMNSVYLHYRVLEEFENGKPLAGTLLVMNRFKSPLTLIAYFEELITAKQEYIEQVFRAFLNNTEITLQMRKVAVLYYKHYCLIIKSTAADEAYNSLFKGKYNHPDDYPKNRDIMHIRNRLADMPKGKIVKEIFDFREDHMQDLYAHMEATRLLFTTGFECKAREIRNKFKGFDPVNTLAYKTAYAYYEIKHGSLDIASFFLKKHEANLNTSCLMVTLHMKEKNLQDASQIWRSIVADTYTIINPLAQRLLYRYYKEWLTDFGINVLTKKF